MGTNDLLIQEVRTMSLKQNEQILFERLSAVKKEPDLQILIDIIYGVLAHIQDARLIHTDWINCARSDIETLKKMRD